MGQLNEKLLSFLLPYIGSYSTNPNMLERIELATKNLLFFVAFFSVLLALYMFDREKITKHFSQLLSVVIIFNFFYRAIFFYNYDSYFSLASQALDLILWLFLLYTFGKRISKQTSRIVSLGVGAALSVLVGTLCIHFESIIYAGSILSLTCHGVLSVWALWQLRHRSVSSHGLSKMELASLAWITLPFIPYLFSPAPPDADIVSMGDILGFVFQGQSLPIVQSGFSNGQAWFLRYPAGIVGSSWLSAITLNLGVSESLLISWFLSFALFSLSMAAWAKTCGIPPLLGVIFSISGITTGYFGLHGGQAQEILAYALGSFFVWLLSQEQRKLAMLFLSACLITHPIIALIFAVVAAADFFFWIFSGRKVFSYISWTVGLPISSVAYLAWLSLGPTEHVSQPAQLLSELNFNLFLQNIYLYLNTDSMGLVGLFAVIPLCGWLRILTPHMSILLFAWFVGGSMIDGLFGHTHWGARFQANFSTIGVWIISCLLAVVLLRKACDRVVLLNAHPKFLYSLCVVLWFFNLKGPGFMLTPVSVFNSHSNIRLAREQSKFMKQDALIFNMRPPATPPDFTDGFGFMLRGEIRAHTLHMRLGPHQLKYGENGPLFFDAQKCPREELPSLMICLRDLGFSHIFIDARPQSHHYVKLSGIKSFKNIKSSYLIPL